MPAFQYEPRGGTCPAVWTEEGLGLVSLLVRFVHLQLHIYVLTIGFTFRNDRFPSWGYLYPQLEGEPELYLFLVGQIFKWPMLIPPTSLWPELGIWPYLAAREPGEIIFIRTRKKKEKSYNIVSAQWMIIFWRPQLTSSSLVVHEARGFPGKLPPSGSDRTTASALLSLFPGSETCAQLPYRSLPFLF